jgi:hypothetical protein
MTKEAKAVKDALKATYLDWVNNYLTVKTMAEHYEVEVGTMMHLIGLGKSAHIAHVDRIHDKNQGN